jgi:mevalonate kinase
MTSAFGKAILLGEHAVVHGHPALAAALDRGVRCLGLTPGGTDVRVEIPEWRVAVAAADDHPVAVALRALIDRAGGAEPVTIALRADLPPGAGLGSSAALAVAITRCLAEAAGRALDDDQVEAIADAAERCFHANPSGIDVALATRGGVGLYRRGQGLTRLDTAPVRLAIGLSGQSRSTGEMVSRVAAALEREPRATGARLETLGAAAMAGAEALVAGDLPTLGRLLSSAHDTLAQLGVSTPVLDQMVEDAVRAGAAGAKLTGGGGGGAVIALAPGREEAIAEAWRATGKESFVCLAGATR